MKYLGMEFKNKEQLEAWTKAGNIEEYKQLVKLFNNNPTMELSSMMSDRAEILHDRFGVSWEEIEQMEMAA